MQQIDIYKLIKAYRKLNERCEFILAITPNRDEWWQLNRKTQKLYEQCKKIRLKMKTLKERRLLYDCIRISI